VPQTPIRTAAHRRLQLCYPPLTPRFSTIRSAVVRPAPARDDRKVGAYDRTYDEGTIEPERSGSSLRSGEG
jgi:hypothetical protein